MEFFVIKLIDVLQVNRTKWETNFICTNAFK